MPSYGTHSTYVVSTPPCSIRSSTRRPTSLSASAVTMAVRCPKQRRSPRVTLYSPPPSHTWNARVCLMRPSPGSSRSITSPSATASYAHDSRGRSVRLVVMATHARGLAGDRHCGAHELGDGAPVLRRNQRAGHDPTAADGKHRRMRQVSRQRLFGNPAGRNELDAAKWRRESLDGRQPAIDIGREELHHWAAQLECGQNVGR